MMNQVKRFNEITLPKLGYIKLGYDLRVAKENHRFYDKYGIIDRISTYTTEHTETLKIRLSFDNNGIIELLDFNEEDLAF